MLCINIEKLSLVENGPVTYVEIFKKFKKKDVLLKATDYYGRNCFHHAALAGNLLGLQLAVKLMLYYYEKAHDVKLSDKGPIV